MHDFHKDKQLYFNYQYWTARDYIIPFLENELDFSEKLDVLEVGCAEAGVLKAFVEKGHSCLGIELHNGRIDLAKEFLKEDYEAGNIDFINRDIYKIDIEKDLGRKFDLVILKDVIEHIPNQEKLLPRLGDFLKPDGKIFFGFPPWYMPFGGHQQICESKYLKKLPWFHLFPMPIYKMILRAFGEKPRRIEDLVEIKETGISIERFFKIVRNSQMQTTKKKFFLTNPIYKFKFKLNVREHFKLFSSIPLLRNFYTTAVYFAVGKK